MNGNSQRPFMLIAAFAALSLAGLAPAAERHCKFVELGWDIPDTAFLRAHGADMERDGPFDGVMFRVDGTAPDGKFNSQSAWDARPWKRQWLAPALADLKACKFARFTDNFLLFNATPGTVAWNDDAGWTALAAKMGHCAWLAREGGAKGLALDFEPYGDRMFQYKPGGAESWTQTVARARARGAQCVRAIAAEYPNAVLLTLFMNSVNFAAGECAQPDAKLAGEGYGLLPAFINGMLDALPPGVVLVDGCENGYYMDSEAEYLRAAAGMRAWDGPAARLVAPENRARYRAQVQAGFGFYLDMFLNEPGNHYYRGPLDGSRLTHLKRNLAAAAGAADEYVWIYGEQCRWWSEPPHAGWGGGAMTKTVGRGRRWEEAMPGVTPAIAWVRNPQQAARDAVEAARANHSLSNLLRNAEFTARAGEGNLPENFSCWQRDDSHGSFAWDGAVGGGAARAAGVADGCFLQETPATPGRRYAVEAAARWSGGSPPSLRVRWQTEAGAWTQETRDVTITFDTTSIDGWAHAFGTATVPGDAGKLLVLFGVRGQTTTNDACWFDNAGVYALP